MTQKNSTQHFNVVGSGYVSEHHADARHQHLLGSEQNAVGGAMAWLAFYVIAIVVVVVSNFTTASDIVVAASN